MWTCDPNIRSNAILTRATLRRRGRGPSFPIAKTLVLILLASISVASRGVITPHGSLTGNANSFQTVGSSWNPRVSCSPAIVKINDITANSTGSTSYSISPFSPGLTSETGSAKRWLTAGSTPPGWVSPGPPCTITDKQGKVVSIFVEVDNVRATSAFVAETDCSSTFNTVNGGGAYTTGGSKCDVTSNLLSSATNSCTGTTDPGCWHRLHVEFDQDWQGAGYCGSGSVCDTSQVRSQIVGMSTYIDVQGFVYWDPDHVSDSWHSYSGWELHPLTAWRLHQSSSQLSTNFTYSPSSSQTGQQVTLTASASGGTAPYTFNWNFGDGSSGIGSTVTHTYSSSGSYTVVLTTKDSSAPQQDVSSQQTVTIANPPPSLMASFSYSPSSPTTTQQITFTASASGGTSPYSFSWSFGDSSTGTGSSVLHTYQAAGSYIVGLTITDANGQTASATQTITVASPPPPPPLTTSFTFSPSTPDAGQSVSFTGSGSGGTQPYKYSWDFGDLGTGSGSSTNHTYQSAGSYSVTLSVTDAGGLIAKASRTITVNAPLSARFTYSPSNPLPLLSVTFTANASGGTSPYNYSWDCGDRATATGASATHSYVLSATYTVTLTVTDANGQTVTTSQTITVLA